MRKLVLTLLIAWAITFAGAPRAQGGTVRVATFNLMNYLCMDRRLAGRFLPAYPKPELEKAAVRAALREVNADVVCLQEIGAQPFLEELRQDLAIEGLTYAHTAWLDAADPMRHVAVLSRLPLRAVTHAHIPFAYLGREERVKRGVLEVSFDSPCGVWTVFTVHLKSPLTEDKADPAAENRRLLEARAVRDLVIQRSGELGERYLIAGDLNATPDARTLSALRSRGDRVVCQLLPAADSRGETWTHRYLAAERYERIDYILASPALAGRVVGGLGQVHDGAGALAGSDHRLVWIDLDVSAEVLSQPPAEEPSQT